jgi:hypothetical protein
MAEEVVYPRIFTCWQGGQETASSRRGQHRFSYTGGEHGRHHGIEGVTVRLQHELGGPGRCLVSGSDDACDLLHVFSMLSKRSIDFGQCVKAMILLWSPARWDKMQLGSSFSDSR